MLTVVLKLYYTEKMPKTATGKIQRRLVAKIMVDREKDAAKKAMIFPMPQPPTSISEGESQEESKGYYKEGYLRESWWGKIARCFCM